MISMGSSATLKNLLSAKPENDDSCFRHLDSTARSLGLQSLPGLYARKQKALEQELDQTLTETFDNIEPSTSPSTSTVGLRDDKFVFSLTERDVYRQRTQQPMSLQKPSPKIRPNVVSHSDSKESVTSTHSDSVYERLMRNGTTDSTSPPDAKSTSGSLKDDRRLHSSMSDSDRAGSDVGKQDSRQVSDRKFLQRYLNNLNQVSPSAAKSSVPANVMNVSSDQNQNNVNVNHLENGIADLKLVEEDDTGVNVKREAWVEHTPSVTDGKQTLSIKEEFNASTSHTEKEEAAESLPSSGNTIAESVNGAIPVPVAAARSRVPQARPFVPVRNKYLESGLEEDLECPTQDRPIDFSRRYGSDTDHAPAPEPRVAKGEAKKAGKGTAAGYGDYAETDLDQPTDYSLQYGEEDDDLSDFDGPDLPISIHEDTIKMYCTEGTPYETPYNFSTATSLSDLRIEPPVKEENEEELKAENEESNVNVSSTASPPEVKETNRPPLSTSDAIESGSVSPAEKPMQFCDEGTPGACMSRFDSLSSLDKQEEVGDVIDGKVSAELETTVDDKCEPRVEEATPPGTPPIHHENQELSADQEGLYLLNGVSYALLMNYCDIDLTVAFSFFRK